MKKKYFCKYIQIKKIKKNYKLVIQKEKIFFRLNKNEVLIKNIFSSINYRDFLSYKGNLAVARNFPYVPGVDFVGKIIYSTNPNFIKNQKVYGFALPNKSSYPGIWSNYFKIDSKYLLKISQKKNLINLATIGTAGLAAASGILSIKNNSNIKDKKLKLVVTGSSGGVGSISCLLGTEMSWNVTAITRNVKNNKFFFNKLGVQNFISTKKFINNSKMNLLPQTYDAAIECLGGKYLSSSIKKLKNNGICVSAGLITSQNISDLTVLPFLLRGIKLVGTGAEVIDKKNKKKTLKIINNLLNNSKLKYLRKTIKFNQIKKYLENWSQTNNKGRVVIKF